MEGGGEKNRQRQSADGASEIVGMHLMYGINKSLKVVPTEETDRVYLVLIREDCFYQRDAFVGKEGTADQAFARRLVRAYRNGSPLWARVSSQ